MVSNFRFLFHWLNWKLLLKVAVAWLLVGNYGQAIISKCQSPFIEKLNYSIFIFKHEKPPFLLFIPSMKRID